MTGKDVTLTQKNGIKRDKLRKRVTWLIIRVLWSWLSEVDLGLKSAKFYSFHWSSITKSLPIFGEAKCDEMKPNIMYFHSVLMSIRDESKLYNVLHSFKAVGACVWVVW